MESEQMSQQWGDMDDDPIDIHNTDSPVIEPITASMEMLPPEPISQDSYRNNSPILKSETFPRENFNSRSRNNYGNRRRGGDRPHNRGRYNNNRDRVSPPPGHFQSDSANIHNTEEKQRTKIVLNPRTVDDKPLSLANYTNSPFGKAIPREENLTRRTEKVTTSTHSSNANPPSPLLNSNDNSVEKRTKDLSLSDNTRNTNTRGTRESKNYRGGMKNKRRGKKEDGSSSPNSFQTVRNKKDGVSGKKNSKAKSPLPKKDTKEESKNSATVESINMFAALEEDSFITN